MRRNLGVIAVTDGEWPCCARCATTAVRQPRLLWGLRLTIMLCGYLLFYSLMGGRAPAYAQSVPTPHVKRLYVANASSLSSTANVYVQDPVTLYTYARIPIASRYIFEVSAMPNGERVYVTHIDGISVIDAATNQVTALLPFPNRYHFLVGKDSRFAYMRRGNFVEVLDLSTHTVVDEIDVGGGFGFHFNREELVQSPDGHLLYVGLASLKQIAVVDVATRTVTAWIDVNDNIDELMMPLRGDRLFVALRSGAVEVIDLTTNRVIDTFVFSEIANSSYIAVAPDASVIYVYVSDYPHSTSYLYRFSTETHELLGIIDRRFLPGATGLDVGPDGIVYMLAGQPPDMSDVLRYDPVTGAQMRWGAGYLPRLVEFDTSEPGRIVVNSTADPGTGGCDDSECTLREAIILANETPEQQVIAFNISGDGPHTIHPTATLPDITDGVIIDGYTQPGAQPNTNPITVGTNAQIKIGIDFGAQDRKLRLLSDGSIVRGLAITNAYWEGIWIAGRSNQIAGNFIGTDFSGTSARVNGTGILLAEGSAGTIIGGNAPADRNLISGNRFTGLAVSQQPNIAVIGNFIGVDSSGQRKLGNRIGIDFYGLYTTESWPMYLGGTKAAERNVISGNYTAVHLQYGSVLMQNNFIGTDVTGTAAMGNSYSGIEVAGFAHRLYNNLIAYNGGNGIWNVNADGPDYNIITHNEIRNNATGISVARGRAEIRENSIYGNSKLGIDLDANGVTQNDNGDLDSGPNDLLNFPVIHVTAYDGNEISLYGSLNSQPNRTYQLAFFANATCDGYGQGEIFLGTKSVDLGAGPNTIFAFNLPASIPPGYGISATTSETIATPTPAVVTSEFALCRPLAGLINQHLRVVNTSYQYVPFAAYPYPDAPGGRFDLTVTFENDSTYRLQRIMLKVATLSNDNVIFGSLNGVTAGEGALFLSPDLAPGATQTFTFWIGLKERRPFDFYVDLYGETTNTVPLVGTGTVGGDGELPAPDQPSFDLNIDRDTIDNADVATGNTIYLPSINR